ncbi:MAG: protein kinase, partial [SAR202 cluster bacterium]|nr:protein kinase [SAR202 cluster bacterium]
MPCSNCGKENPSQARFCMFCANPLATACPRCGVEAPPEARFCMSCAAPLTGDVTPPEHVATEPPAPPVTEQPASFAEGRYVVSRFLGLGGKKLVYLAHDELLDRDVAFALIKTEGLDDASRQRISREAQAMGRLGSHPHIVTVFDLGEHPSATAEGQPFMVTELMGGGDVEGVLEDADGGRLSLEQAISIAAETCRGLEFAHSKGIVHRDLKPGNVWLTGDGVAKIGDFGLAVATDRSRLTQEGMMVGTVSYMPPEQARGGAVTPRADLYSLGARIYEMVCGRPPVLGDDSVAIIGQHINTPPVAPTWHRSDCPRPLEALIMRLLAKDPAEPPESASDVLAALEAVDTSSSEQSVTEPGQSVNVLDSLAGDVFVGRQREMDQLKAALEDALGGRGRMVTLVGEPGIGKTRTACRPSA